MHPPPDRFREFQQKNTGARRCAIAPKRVEFPGAALGAEAGHVNPLPADARRLQLAAHGFRQVDVRRPSTPNCAALPRPLHSSTCRSRARWQRADRRHGCRTARRAPPLRSGGCPPPCRAIRRAPRPPRDGPGPLAAAGCNRPSSPLPPRPECFEQRIARSQHTAASRARHALRRMTCLSVASRSNRAGISALRVPNPCNSQSNSSSSLTR